MNSIEDELKKQLSQIDKESIRSIRAVLTGSYIEDDMRRLVILEKKASLIRIRLSKIKRGTDGKRGKNKHDNLQT